MRDRSFVQDFLTDYRHVYEYPPWFGGDSIALVGPIGRSEQSFMSDTTGRRSYNPVSHTKLSSSIINGVASQEANINGTDGTWPVILRVASYLSEEQILQIDTSASGIPWSDLVVSLADGVRGLIKSKSLLAVSLKELPQTLQMVRNPFGLLKPHWREIAGKFSASRLAKRGANLWLEGRYGWGAGWYDICNFVKATNRLQTALSNCKSSSGSELFHASWKGSSALTSSFGWAVEDLNSFAANGGGAKASDNCVSGIELLNKSITAHVTCEALAGVSNTANALDKFMSAYGLDTRSLLPTLWEILPYSFVVDWFIHFPNLRANSSEGFLSQQGISKLGYSTKVEVFFITRCVPTTPWAYSGSIWKSPLHVLEGDIGRLSIFHRECGCPGDATALTGADLSAIQATDLSSLIIQRLRR